MMPVKITKTAPTYSPFQPHALVVAATMELDCTALNAKPKVKIKVTAKAIAIGLNFKPRVM